MTTAANPGDVFWVQAAAPGTRKAVRVVEVVGDHIKAIDSTPYEAQLYPIQSKRKVCPIIVLSDEVDLDDSEIEEYLNYFRDAINDPELIGLLLEAFVVDPLWPTIKKRLWSKFSPSEQLAVRSAIAGSDFSIPPKI
jgi:hypothetical protein